MQEKSKLTLKIFILCLLFNGIMLAALYVASDQLFQGTQTRYEPLLAGPDAQSLPEGLRSSLQEIKTFGLIQEKTMKFVLLGLGVFVTLILAFAVQLLARGAWKRAAAGKEAVADSTGGKKPGKADRPAREKEVAKPSPVAAVQILSALQREGRLIDFIQEDLDIYEDAQIGAAVRSIHEGCRKAISEHLELKPVYEQEEEGAEVTVKPGFDARAVRLTGNVAGDPPFRGVLRHRGWRVVRLELPSQVTEQNETNWVLAPAEVEIEQGEAK